MKALLCCLLLWCLPACAKEKAAYQDGTLVSYRTITTGSSCSHTANTNGTVDATTDDSGQTNGTVQATTYGSTDCGDIRRAEYTVKVGNNIFVLEPAHSGKAAAGVMLTMGWGALALKSSVLYGAFPGTAIKVRFDGGTFYVRVGKRESKYKLVGAE